MILWEKKKVIWFVHTMKSILLQFSIILNSGLVSALRSDVKELLDQNLVFSLSWEVSFWEMVYLYCDSRRHLSPRGDKAELPRDQRRWHKICCSWEKREDDGSWVKPGSPQQNWGQSWFKTPLTDVVDVVAVTSVFTESGDVLVGSGFKFKELIDFGEFQTLPSCVSIREESHKVKFSGAAKNWELEKINVSPSQISHLNFHVNFLM